MVRAIPATHSSALRQRAMWKRSELSIHLQLSKKKAIRGLMDSAYLSALSALAGSATCAFSSFATTWITQHSQERTQRAAQAVARREHLYAEFIEEASKLYTDAISHELDDPSNFVHIYAIVGKLRLFTPSCVITKAEEVTRRIVEIYNIPSTNYRNPADRQQNNFDVLKDFSVACRQDLGV